MTHPRHDIHLTVFVALDYTLDVQRLQQIDEPLFGDEELGQTYELVNNHLEVVVVEHIGRFVREEPRSVVVLSVGLIALPRPLDQSSGGRLLLHLALTVPLQ